MLSGSRPQGPATGTCASTDSEESVNLRPRNSPLTCLLLSTVFLTLVGCSDTAGSGGDGKQVADLGAAKTWLQPYMEDPAGLLNTEPLAELPAPGSTVVYLDGGTPIQAAFWESLKPTAPVLGINLKRVPTGQDAQGINSALDSVVESKPAAVINVAVDPTLFSRQLDDLRAEGVTVVSTSIVNGAEFGFEHVLSNAEQTAESGKALASTAIVRTEGKASEFVFYTVPELAFSGLEQKGAQEQMKEQCPDCTLRVVDIPVTTLGTTAADAVVSDLQAHPETDYFLAALDEIQIGLPGRLKVAGIDVKGVGATPAAANLQQIADGQQDATIALDLNLFMWTAMDQAMRELGGQEVAYPDDATAASTTHHLITKENMVDDPEVGWTAIPDYKEQFTKLWTGK